VFRSLRSRVALTAVISVAVTSLLVTLSIALALGPVSEHNQEIKARIILDRAVSLENKVSPARLADRLSEPGFSVVVTQDGNDYPSSNSTVAVKTVDKDNDYYSVSETLPKTGATVTVATLNISTFDIYGQILAIGLPTIILALVVLVLALRAVTGVALRPLNDMTSLAMKITDGELGQRLEVDDPNTELGKTAVAFDKMLDALENSLMRARLAEERLRQLCADVAHELRSPVSSMVAAADNLMREVSLGKRTAAATRTLAEETAMAVVRDGRRAGRIVGDLTLAAQLDVAELAEREVVKQRVDVSRILVGVVDSFAIGSDYAVTLEDKAGETWVQADPERVQQILTNLLSNANRWTESSIFIKTSRSGKSWVVTVTDDGPGVPADYREAIFGRFVRLDTARDRSRGGSGLGLAISRALAEAHGGKLVCLENATPKGGAVFRLTLPVAAVAEAPAEATAPAPAPAPAEG
jgi:signal transduction histidine kinase